jgi:hypothetical protein
VGKIIDDSHVDSPKIYRAVKEEFLFLAADFMVLKPRNP